MATRAISTIAPSFRPTGKSTSLSLIEAPACPLSPLSSHSARQKNNRSAESVIESRPPACPVLPMIAPLPAPAPFLTSLPPFLNPILHFRALSSLQRRHSMSQSEVSEAAAAADRGSPAIWVSEHRSKDTLNEGNECYGHDLLNLGGKPQNNKECRPARCPMKIGLELSEPYSYLFQLCELLTITRKWNCFFLYSH